MGKGNKNKGDAKDKSKDKKDKQKLLSRVEDAVAKGEIEPVKTATAEVVQAGLTKQKKKEATTAGSSPDDKQKKKKAKKNKKKADAKPEETDTSATDTKAKDKKEKKDKKKSKKDGAEGGKRKSDESTDESPKNKSKKVKTTASAGAASAVTTANATDSEAYRTKHRINVVGMDVGVVTRFDQCGFPDELVATCSDFKEPTPIQAQAWPVILSGRDIIGIAATGSGKTIAFSYPAFMHIANARPKKNKGDAPLVLVIAPTRELASQTADVCDTVGDSMGLRSLCVYGGVDKRPQKDALKRGIDILVCTPGRLLDLHEEGVCRLNEVSYLVLDEADRMLDLGFEKDIRRIINELAPKRRTCMFSATWPVSIQKLANEFLNNAVKIIIGCEDLAANHNVKQTVEVVNPKIKDRKLADLLKRFHKKGNRVIIFALYKKEAERLHQTLMRSHNNAVCAIHGNMGQRERLESLGQFKKGTKPLLVATDVAARGLDIPDVEVVINYTFPLTIEDYVHRIGRTGRAGKSGISYTLFTEHDKLRAGDLQNILREAGEDVPEALMAFGSHTKRKEHKLYGNIGDKGDNVDTKVDRMTFD